MTFEHLFPHADVIYYCIVLLWYIVAIIAGLLGLWAGFRAFRRFLREKTFERLTICYSLVNALFRSGLTIQKRVKEKQKYELQPLIESMNALKNWYFDHRFLFAGKPEDKLGEKVNAAVNEARHIAVTGDMTRLLELRQELETRLAKPF